MKIYNKRAKFDYKLEDKTYEAGISLSGGEARAVRTGHLDLSQSHSRIMNGEAFLINANIPVLGSKLQSTRARRLLLHKHEIVSILTKMKQRKLTLVPIKMYTKGRLIKVELSLGKTKRKFEKRDLIKKKDIQREIERELRQK